jgi:hypothetical protein
MALGDAYITNTQLKAYLGINDVDDDVLLTAACVGATERVNQHCQRQFNKATTATARTFAACNSYSVDVDDFHTITDLVVKTDTGSDGTYATTRTDFVLSPSEGVVGGVTGWPFRKVRFISNAIPASEYPQVQVTAQWGWNAIPESVVLATKIIAALLFNLKDSPLGVAQFGSEGLIRVRDVPQAAMLLRNYQHPGKTGPFLR